MRFLKVLKAVFVRFPVWLAKKVVRFFKAIPVFLKALFSLSSVLSNVEVFQKKLEKVEDVINQHVRWLTKIESKVDKMEEELKAGDVPEDDGAKKPGGSEKTGNGVQNINFTKLMSAEGKKELLDSVPFEIIVKCFYQGLEKGSLDSASLAGYMVNHPGASIKVLAKIYNSDTIGYAKNEMERQGFGERLDGMDKEEIRKELGLPTIKTGETAGK